jgi:hypothetical protein
MDSALIPKGVKRCPMWQFLLGLGIVGAVLRGASMPCCCAGSRG